jgi:transposase-like protein
LHWFLHFAEQGRSVSATCRHFGISRSAFYRWMRRLDPDNLASLEERPNDPATLNQSIVPPEVVALIHRYRTETPLMGKEKIRDALETAHGVRLSASTIGRVIERECLYFGDTPLHWKKRNAQRGMEQESTQEPSAATPAAFPAPAAEPPFTERHAVSHMPVTAAPEPDGCCGDEVCARCELRGRIWIALKRAALYSSLLVNVALISSMLVTAFWERSNAVLRHAAAGKAPAIHTTLDSD